ncbi:MAG TPA: aldo/keto reductase [Nocardioidaceae bacterium]|nr:aldo/keto reductase [Nocardioidaceae bacterium]
MTQPVEVPHDVVTLPGGGRMPLLGFGTWQLEGRDAVEATSTALEAGYRHLDTATIYGNEAEVGRALAESGVARDDVFVTTKCPPDRAGQELGTLRRSLDLLGMDRVDLWLVHWPARNGADPALWSAFVEARGAGLARDIGVSNFGTALLDEVTGTTGVAPAVNQVRWSPLLFDSTVLAEHRGRGVTLEGYSALRGGTLTHPTIAEVADRVGRTAAQVIVRWHLQHGVVVIPKSRDPERVRGNADVAGFALSAEDMASLDALGRAP